MKVAKIGSVIQISPEFVNPIFGGCFAIVNEEKGWGVLAYVLVPGKGQAYVRVPNEHLQIIGDAVWIITDEGEIVGVN